MDKQTVIINTYNDGGDNCDENHICEALVNNTGEGTKISTQEALGNLCQLLADKGLMTSKEFGGIIDIEADDIWFRTDKDCPF